MRYVNSSFSEMIGIMRYFVRSGGKLLDFIQLRTNEYCIQTSITKCLGDSIF